jgi:hypothetical protein
VYINAVQNSVIFPWRQFDHSDAPFNWQDTVFSKAVYNIQQHRSRNTEVSSPEIS